MTSGQLARVIVAACLVLARAMAASAQEPVPEARPATRAEVAQLFEAGDFAGAAARLEQRLKASPGDPFDLYNLACALAMSGQIDPAAERLLDALSAGFVDFHHMEADPHLVPLHADRRYRAVINGWARVLDERAKAELDAARRALGPAYTYEQDEALRISFASAFPAESFEDAKREIGLVAAWAREQFPGMTNPDPACPDPWVLVILPTPDDFDGLVGMLGVGGVYDRDAKRLVTQDLGPSLRHEFFHVLHWRHMDRLGQRHPYWVMEGLACVPEDVDPAQQGVLRPIPSWRTNIAKRLEKMSGLTPWPRLFTLQRGGFMGSFARGHYAQSRALFMFLHERGALGAWYHAFTSNFTEDPTGLLAIETALAAPRDDVWKQYRAWFRALPEVAEQARPGAAWMGATFDPGAGDGPVVTSVSRGARRAAADGERLRARDVLRSIDGQPVRTLDDLHLRLSGRQPGQRVEVEVRRFGKPLTFSIELLAPPREEDSFP
jgi:hypothetical protein